LCWLIKNAQHFPAVAATFFEKPKEMMVLGIGIVSAKRDLLVASFVVKVGWGTCGCRMPVGAGFPQQTVKLKTRKDTTHAPAGFACSIDCA
jgi:hypothetical protein